MEEDRAVVDAVDEHRGERKAWLLFREDPKTNGSNSRFAELRTKKLVGDGDAQHPLSGKARGRGERWGRRSSHPRPRSARTIDPDMSVCDSGAGCGAAAMGPAGKKDAARLPLSGITGVELSPTSDNHCYWCDTAIQKQQARVKWDKYNAAGGSNVTTVPSGGTQAVTRSRSVTRNVPSGSPPRKAGDGRNAPCAIKAVSPASVPCRAWGSRSRAARRRTQRRCTSASPASAPSSRSTSAFYAASSRRSRWRQTLPGGFVRPGRPRSARRSRRRRLRGANQYCPSTKVVSRTVHAPLEFLGVCPRGSPCR